MSQPICTIVYCIKTWVIEESMKEYTKNNEMCRREILLKDFDGSVGGCTSSCSCCDVCESKCTCTNCS